MELAVHILYRAPVSSLPSAVRRRSSAKVTYSAEKIGSFRSALSSWIFERSTFRKTRSDQVSTKVGLGLCQGHLGYSMSSITEAPPSSEASRIAPCCTDSYCASRSLPTSFSRKPMTIWPKTTGLCPSLPRFSGSGKSEWGLG